MIQNVRIDYRGSNEGINMNTVSEFVSQIQQMLSDIASEINQQNGALVVTVYDGKRMTYSFENISPETAQKINRLSRP
jgi:ABC-type xylose transport system substrate-binding protein